MSSPQSSRRTPRSFGRLRRQWTQAEQEGSRRGEFFLRSAGIVLAISATAFAAQMISTPDRVPTFAGAEHLSIFSRPSVLAARRDLENGALFAARKNGVDYTPVGALDDRTAPVNLAQYSLIEANQTHALIRDPRGSIVRVMRGDVVAGVGRIDSIERHGKRWAVVTTNGIIVESPVAPH